VKIKLTPANAPECCATLIRSYKAVPIGGRVIPPSEWLKPGYRISLFCKECEHGVQYTLEDGWTRTMNEEDAMSRDGVAA
jgi:hypothetical protein